MGDKFLTIDQQDEINLRIGFLREVFRILHEVRESETLTLSSLETVLLDAENKLNEIGGILNGKKIIPNELRR